MPDQTIAAAALAGMECGKGVHVDPDSVKYGPGRGLVRRSRVLRTTVAPARQPLLQQGGQLTGGGRTSTR